MESFQIFDWKRDQFSKTRIAPVCWGQVSILSRQPSLLGLQTATLATKVRISLFSFFLPSFVHATYSFR